MADVLDRVARGNLCAGCGACAALAPDAVTMALSPPGYLRPHKHSALSAEQDAAITAVCPGLGLTQTPGARTDDPLWGPVVRARTGHATDAELRYQGSSGGALSAVLVHLLGSGAVDAVVQITADPDNPVANRTILSRTPQEVFAAAGSRYAPSAPLAELDAYLDTTDSYVFVGKPCDVAALRAWARHDPRVDARFAYMLSFFCAGVPSQTGAHEILTALETTPTDVTAFRYRGNGWPGFATATLRDGTERKMTYADSWGNILTNHLQMRCKICPDGTGGFADLVFADVWDADADGFPVFTEGAGTSLILSRTETGEGLAQACAGAGGLHMADYDLAGLTKVQPGQTMRRSLVLARVLAMRLVGRPAPRYRGFHLWQNAKRAGLKTNLRNALGTVRRVLRSAG